jgi:hypothetical protein
MRGRTAGSLLARPSKWIAMEHDEYFELNDGEVRAWIEQGASIHIKAVAQNRDPVELTESQARKLANALLSMVKKLEEAG